MGNKQTAEEAEVAIEAQMLTVKENHGQLVFLKKFAVLNDLAYDDSGDVEKLIAEAARENMVIEDIKFFDHGDNHCILLRMKDVPIQLLGLSEHKLRDEVAVIIFRGTHNFTEVMEDLKASICTDFLTGDGEKIAEGAAGFIEGYNNLKQVGLLDECLKHAKHEKGHRIVITGHSLGGAMATLMATEIHIKYPHVKMALVTYGQPRALSTASADIARDYPFFYARCVNHGDIVPKVPPAFLGFKHFGMPIFYKIDASSDGEWDLHIEQDFDGAGIWETLAEGILATAEDVVTHLITGKIGYLNRLKEGLIVRASKFGISPNHGHDDDEYANDEEIVISTELKVTETDSDGTRREVTAQVLVATGDVEVENIHLSETQPDEESNDD